MNKSNAELIVDNFAGGGGASTGIEMALGRSPDLAVNHDPEAMALHEANHPQTGHFCEDVFDIDPVTVTNGRPVGLAWFSPDCKHFSKAKGGTPKSKKIRGLAWVMVRWAAKVAPRVMVLENVEEFKTWGPLLACDYGAPTIRKRLFLIARRDGQPIVWPTPTHGAPDNPLVLEGRLKPWRTAAECLDFSIPCPSIFDRPRRIARGLRKFVIEADKPFIVNVANSKTTGRGPNVWDVEEPLRTVTASPGFAICSPYLTEHANASTQRIFGPDEPLRTQCAQVKGGRLFDGREWNEVPET